MALKKEKIERTRYELRRQVFLGVFLFFIFNIWGILDFTEIWLGVTLLLTLLGTSMLMFARRAIWVSLWRTLTHLVAYLSLTIGAPIFAFNALNIFEELPQHERTVILSVAIIFFVAGLILYHFLWIIPHWRDTYQQNLIHKIKLDKATFSVTANWARRDGGSGSLGLWLPWVIIAGPMLFLILKYSGVLSAGVVIFAAYLLLVAGMLSALTDLYNAYKIIEIERNIGRPLIIDIYADK